MKKLNRKQLRRIVEGTLKEAANPLDTVMQDGTRLHERLMECHETAVEVVAAVNRLVMPVDSITDAQELVESLENATYILQELLSAVDAEHGDTY